MKIGIFDSGMGGLVVAKSIIARLPEYDYVYLGDTARVPYGNRSQELIYQFTEQAVEKLIELGCGLIIIACNTASAEALCRIQQVYLPEKAPTVRVLGVLIPATEAAVLRTKNNRIGILATASTVASGAYVREVKKLLPESIVIQQAAPLLVPFIENRELEHVQPILEAYVKPLIEQGVDTVILGCTHYPILRNQITQILGDGIAVIGQDECVSESLARYLQRHTEIRENLSQTSEYTFLVTDVTKNMEELAAELFSKEVTFQQVSLG